ncbi:MAG: twitching motility protein PilT [Verrucomicrobia bacterium]|nr:twitching motility protein PilT [Verrucomicrobiota bacterium]
MTLWVLRIVFVGLCMLGSWAISQLDPSWERHPWMAMAIGFVSGGALIGIDLATKSFSVRGLTAATFGLLVGTLISYFIGNSKMFELIDPNPRIIAQISMFLFVTYLSMVIALRGKDEFNLLIPYVKFRREEAPERLLLLDSNIIIDGRILDVASTGFLDVIFVIPRFILHELQWLADSSDDIKRARGRRGLDILKQLQKNPRIEFKIHENDIPEIKETDGKLVELARRISAEILTNDYNLNRVAELQKVRVLNLHELSKALRPVVLPGERLTLKLVKEGREPEQAVGYLEDGTMVVVQRSRRLLGREVDVIIESVLQTAAGRMAFARLQQDNEENPRKNG